jgi:hypothetical protein
MRELARSAWPHKIRLNYVADNDSLTRMETWLRNNVGEDSKHWYVIYHYDGTDFYFKDQQDAVWFSLKWVA